MKKLTGILLIMFSLAMPATAQEFDQDVNYFELMAPQPVSTGDKIEVLELFWYGCPHCYSLEPYLVKWLKNKPDFVEFVRLPAVLNRSWAFDAQAYMRPPLTSVWQCSDCDGLRSEVSKYCPTCSISGCSCESVGR